MDGPGGDGSADAARSAKADALDILADVPAWRSTPKLWEQTERIMESMSAALADNDADALRRATIELELISPRRVIRVGDVDESPEGPPPEPVRDRLNRLIHDLGGAAEPETDEA